MPIKNIHNRLIDKRPLTDFATLIRENAELYGDKPCYVYKQKKQELQYSYNDMYNCATRLGAALEKLGLLGECVAIIGEASPAYMTTYFAVVNGNGVIIPLDK